MLRLSISGCSCLVLAATLACSKSTPPAPAGEPPSASDEAPAPSAAPPATGHDGPQAESVDAAPADEAEPEEGDAAEPEPEAPLPAVTVKNIGMHIGGGPNDAATKRPIKVSVEPHFDALRRCFAKVDDPQKGGDFGVDLRIEREGGRAGVSHPRTSLEGEGFSECVLAVFEAVEFEKPKGGATVVSYSLRFTPD